MLCTTSLERLFIVHKVRYLRLGGSATCIVEKRRSVLCPPWSQSTVTGKLVNETILEQRECCWSQQHSLELGVIC